MEGRWTADISDPNNDTESEVEPEDQESLLIGEGEKAALSKTGKATVFERIILFLEFVRQNKRNLAAAVSLWAALLTATGAYSLLAPFFPQEVNI